jgi:hypothetical protein
MAVSRRGTPTGVVDNRGVATIVLPVTAGSTTGDMLYAFMGSIGTAPVTMATPTGWTKVGERQNSGTDNTTSYIYQKPAAASEAANYTFTFGSNAKSLGIIVTYSGVDLAATPVYAAIGGSEQPRALAAPAIELAAGDWLATYTFGRQSPASDVEKSWTIDAASDTELVDAYHGEAGTSRAGTHALYDSNGPMPGGQTARQVVVTPQIQQTHVWSLRIPVAGGQSGGGGGGSTPGTWSSMGIPIR